MREEDYWPKNSDEPIIYHIVQLEFEGHHPMLQILLQIYDGSGLVALAINNSRGSFPILLPDLFRRKSHILEPETNHQLFNLIIGFGYKDAIATITDHAMTC